MNDRTVAGPRALAFSLAIAALLPSSSALAADRVVSNARAADLSQTARSLPRGASLRVEGTALEEFSEATGLDLVRFEPAAPGIKFVAQTANGPAPIHPDVPVYFRGSVDGMRGSVAVLSFRSNGEVRGVVTGADGTWMLGRRAGGPAELRSRKVRKRGGDPASSFSCEHLDNPAPRRTVSGAPRSIASTASPAASSTASASTTASPGATARIARLPLVYTAQIAVELDHEFYQLFSDAGEAALYALDLMAFTGSLGESEFGMNVQVPYIFVWTTAADPYSGAEIPRLNQVRLRWNESGQTYCGGDDCTTIPRSTTILMSGTGSGGVAYVPALCDWYHTTTGGYSYAYAGSMDANFDIDSPSMVWDILVVTHELGHNFGSLHTHCYSPPVDHCNGGEGMGCYSGATSLPSGCPGSGQGCGTLMSYCHGLSGGISNVSLTYGSGHPYGDTPQRVPDTIIDQIELEAASTPACLTVTDGMVELEVSTNGTGNGTVTSSPPGIDCGTACHTYFNADEPVTLTPTPTAFSQFTGWSGDADCNDGVVTMATATSCVATFDGSCGMPGEDCEDHNPCTTDSCPGDLACVNAATPRDESTCFESPLTRFKITNDGDPNKNKLQWQWLKGEAVLQGDIGTPSGDTDYALCVYDTTAGVPSLATSLALPGGSAGWSDRSPDGWKYSDGEGNFDGYRKVDMRTGIAGKSRVKLKAGGPALPLPVPFSGSEQFDEDPSVVVQLLSSDGNCWTSEFAVAGTTRNTPTTFNATGD